MEEKLVTKQIRVFYRLVSEIPPSVRDLLSQGARRQPPPRDKKDDLEFAVEWAGLSVFDTYREAYRLGKRINWKPGEFIAELRIPEDAPLTYRGPASRGHWLIYDENGGMLTEKSAQHIREHYVTRLVHGPSTPEWE